MSNHLSRLPRTFGCCLAVAGLVAGGCASSDASRALRTVDRVDLPRYMGDWYVIANIPYFFEKGKVATIERYELRPDGKIANTFLFRKGSFEAPQKDWHAVASVTNAASNAEWKVQFVWPLKVDYAVVDLDPEYRWAAVGHPSRKYFWVLARERTLPETTYRGILERAAAQGFPVEKVQKVPQPGGTPLPEK